MIMPFADGIPHRFATLPADGRCRFGDGRRWERAQLGLTAPDAEGCNIDEVTPMSIHSILIAGAALLAAAVPASAATPTPQARLDKLLEGRVAGKPVDCINLRDIRSSEIIDRTAIVYRTGANRLYVNRPRGGESQLDRDDILVTRTSSSQLCSIDTVGLLDRTSRFQTGFVSLGAFVPYAKP
jgi:hypothetical protein